jgi:predicted RNase H-like nuclease (RuvC/YqgF family)
MPPEEKHKINVWIPESLWKQIGSLGYDSSSKATIAAFEALVLKEASGSKQEALGSTQEATGNDQEALGSSQKIEGYKRDITGYKENIKALNVEIARLRESLANSPDPVELAEVRAHFTGLQRLLEEKDKSIERLEREVGTLNGFAHYFKNVEVKQIEAPASEKVKQWWKFW